MPAADQVDYGVPRSKTVPSHIILRPATTADAKGMSECFFTSFWPSHPFWTYEFPPRLIKRWWISAWTMGVEQDSTMRTFVAVDTRVTDPEAQNAPDGRIIAFTRWRIPQHDGNLSEMWPDLPEGLDMDILGPFFGGMHKNRSEFMAGRPHWFLQMLGTEVEYQRLGIGEAFVQWGCDHADNDDMEVYIDASEKGAPFYQKHFGAMPRALIPIPEKPRTFGKFTYVTHIRPKKSERYMNGHAE